jgi:hypothetical protein
MGCVAEETQALRLGFSFLLRCLVCREEQKQRPEQKQGQEQRQKQVLRLWRRMTTKKQEQGKGKDKDNSKGKGRAVANRMFTSHPSRWGCEGWGTRSFVAGEGGASTLVSVG